MTLIPVRNVKVALWKSRTLVALTHGNPREKTSGNCLSLVFFFLLAGTRCPNKGQDWFEQEDRSLFVQKSHESILIASKVPDVPKSFDPQRGNNEFVF